MRLKVADAYEKYFWVRKRKKMRMTLHRNNSGDFSHYHKGFAWLNEISLTALQLCG